MEICSGRNWASVCDNHWDNLDAGVVCYELGYSMQGSEIVLP